MDRPLKSTIDGTLEPLSDEEFAAWSADPGPPPPPARRVLLPLGFRNLFLPAEEVAITAAAQAAPQLRVWLDRLNAASEVDLDDPRTVAGLDALVAAGLITEARRDQIAAGQPPGE